MYRRSFLRHAAAAPFIARGASAPGNRPNIVLILADDMGYSDLGCYGGEISTPNIDRLAADGVRFTQFYNAAKCCPTRSALLTGLCNHQTGVGHMDGDFGLPSYRGRLSENCVTIAEVLREAGYRTQMSGKWHVGGQRPHWPLDRGFEQYFGLLDGASSFFEVDEGRRMAHNNELFSPPKEGFYMTDAFTDHAVRMLEECRGRQQPFFHYIAYTSPHWPLHALEEDIRKYDGKYMAGWDRLREQRFARMREMGIIDQRWPLSPRDPAVPAWDTVADKEVWARRMAVYAAQIDRMDQGIGRVLGKLKEIGAEENTLVMLLSDNGACQVRVDRRKGPGPIGSRNSYESYSINWSNASNTPFRRHKSMTGEGGISTPFIARWPKVIRKGTMTGQPGHIIDVMATCVEIAGAAYPKTYRANPIKPLEGRSLAAVLNGKTRQPHETLCWEHMGNRAVRHGNMKLVADFGGQWELYDVEADRSEVNNLAAKQPETVRALEARYNAWAERCGVVAWDKLRGRQNKNKKG